MSLHEFKLQKRLYHCEKILLEVDKSPEPSMTKISKIEENLIGITSDLRIIDDMVDGGLLGIIEDIKYDMDQDKENIETFEDEKDNMKKRMSNAVKNLQTLHDIYHMLID